MEISYCNAVWFFFLPLSRMFVRSLPTVRSTVEVASRGVKYAKKLYLEMLRPFPRPSAMRCLLLRSLVGQCLCLWNSLQWKCSEERRKGPEVACDIRTVAQLLHVPRCESSHARATYSQHAHAQRSLIKHLNRTVLRFDRCGYVIQYLSICSQPHLLTMLSLCI